VKPLEGQLDLFSRPRTGREEYERQPVPLNSSVPEHERARLSPQHDAILARLRQGPATNLELEAIAHRFGARLHELKRAGHEIKRECVESGVYRYELIEWEE
jgi:hypothetical protein